MNIGEVRKMPIEKLDKKSLIKIIDAMCRAGEALRDQMQKESKQNDVNRDEFSRLRSDLDLAISRERSLKQAIENAVSGRTTAINESEHHRKQVYDLQKKLNDIRTLVDVVKLVAGRE